MPAAASDHNARMSFDLSDVVIYNEEPSLLTAEQLKAKYVVTLIVYSSILCAVVCLFFKV